MFITDMEILVRDIFPNCTFDEDNYGQIIIYTDTMISNGVIVPFWEA